MGTVISFKEYKEQNLGCSTRVQIPLWVQCFVHPFFWFLFSVPCAEEEGVIDPKTKSESL